MLLHIPQIKKTFTTQLASIVAATLSWASVLYFCMGMVHLFLQRVRGQLNFFFFFQFVVTVHEHTSFSSVQVGNQSSLSRQPKRNLPR